MSDLVDPIAQDQDKPLSAFFLFVDQWIGDFPMTFHVSLRRHVCCCALHMLAIANE
jgi:hypothetical protein